MIPSATLALLSVVLPGSVAGQAGPTEAPTGLDNHTGGFISQGQFNQVRAAFEHREDVNAGLGPIYNAQSCTECHASPVPGGSSQIAELLAGRLNGLGQFVANRAADSVA